MRRKKRTRKSLLRHRPRQLQGRFTMVRAALSFIHRALLKLAKPVSSHKSHKQYMYPPTRFPGASQTTRCRFAAGARVYGAPTSGRGGADERSAGEP